MTTADIIKLLDPVPGADKDEDMLVDLNSNDLTRLIGKGKYPIIINLSSTDYQLRSVDSLQQVPPNTLKEFIFFAIFSILLPQLMIGY